MLLPSHAACVCRTAFPVLLIVILCTVLTVLRAGTARQPGLGSWSRSPEPRSQAFSPEPELEPLCIFLEEPEPELELQKFYQLRLLH